MRTVPLLGIVLLPLVCLAAEQSNDHVSTTLFETSGNYDVTIWAKSPDLRNPTNMDIDHAGRVWVTEGVNYRWSKGRDPEGDRIVVLEDTDQDGVCDKSWTFVQEPELIAPLGIAVIDNKIYVSAAPDLIVYTDVDRDLAFDPRVDKREVLLTGFNGINHDHALHSVTFGPDGKLYFNHGNSGAFVTDRNGNTYRVGSAYSGLLGRDTKPLYGILPSEYSGAQSDDGHVYVGGFAMRMNEDGTGLEVVGHGFRNSYEQTVTSGGEVFQNDNDDPPACRTSYLLEYGNAGFFSRDGLRYWQADRRPGQSIPTAQWRQEDPGIMPAGDVYGAGAPTGIAFYEGDLFGDEFRGTLLSCEAALNVIFGYKPESRGAGYELDRYHFLTSNKEQEIAGTDGKRGKLSDDIKTFFRPSDVTVGPDGAIYVADWFDPRVGGHADKDETVSGTIYRIAPSGKSVVTPEIELNTDEGLLESLKSPAVNVRGIGYKAFKERGADAVEIVSTLLKDANPYIRLRAIWLLAELGDRGVKIVESLLEHEDGRVRATAYQALRNIDYDIAVLANRMVNDQDSRVIREVALSMRDLSYSESKDILLRIGLNIDAIDRTLLEAWGIGCTGKEAAVYELLLGSVGSVNPIKWDPNFAALAWRLTPEAAVRDFEVRASSDELSEQERLDAVTAIAFTGTEDTVDALFNLSNEEGRIGETAKWWLLNYRSSRYSGLGVDSRLKKEGIYDPDTIIVAPSQIPEPVVENLLNVDDVSNLVGDIERGKAKAGACLACHRIGELGVDYGPDLNGWASRQSLDVTIRSIVQPNDDIAHGYSGREVVLKDGTIVHGLIESQGDPLRIRSMGGILQMIPQERVERVNWYNRSLMLSADQLGLNEQDVADIVAYLKTL
ncbi:PVC-type heme-binding CxxCH protein [Pelagicoccus mobilis]|uniref:HEAT repeat domain-containing protein n=1 Tax=Pelagicoccus mobilis TaxID=415221 RepID=A0A934S6I4_9BACT|nr:PVC-type heme-binding CxxCH protein [Pelagicoccus mobilis]MBK1880632.1 HEAT repeat domain-containing protein [Pelagicoccus mobilis]